MALQRPSFTTTKLREGYDMGEVDDAVDRVFSALAEPVPTMSAEDVTTLRFTPVRLREGYDMDKVDGWLDQAAAELDRAAGGAAPGTPAPTAHQTTGTTSSEAITEVRSGPSRVLAVLTLVVLAAVLAYVYYA